MMGKLGFGRKKVINSQLVNGRHADRGRRMGFGAFHFRQEKICKQLLAAVGAGDVNTVKHFIDSGLDVEQIDDGVPALRLACQTGDLEIVSLLVNLGAHVNSCGDSTSAPLHVAAQKGHAHIVALLLSHAANVNLLTKSEQRSALHIAALSNNDDCVRVLIANDAKVNIKDIYGTVPLHLAAQKGCCNIVKLLLEHGAAVDAYDNDGWTALHLVAETGNIAVATILFEFHCHVDCQNKYGRTPLHWACSSVREGMVRLLLQHKASANIKDFHEKRALNYASDTAIHRLVKPHTMTELESACLRSVSTIGLHVRINPRLNDVQNNSNGAPEPARTPVESVYDVTGIDGRDDMNANKNNSLTRASVSNGSPGSIRSQNEWQIQCEQDERNKPSQCQKSSACALGRRSALAPNIGKDAQNLSPSLSQSSTCSSAISDSSGKSPPVERRFWHQDSIISESSYIDDESKEIGRRREQLTQTFTGVIDGLSSIKKSIHSASRDLSRSCDTVNPGVMAGTLKDAKISFQSLINLISDVRQECKANIHTTQQSMDQLFKQFGSRFSERVALPMPYYQAFFLATAAHISQQENGWRIVMKNVKKSEHQDEMIDRIAASGQTEMERTLQSLIWVVSKISEDTMTVIRDVTKFLGKCRLPHFNKCYLMKEVISLVRPSFKFGMAIKGSTLSSLVSRFTQDDAKKVCSRLDILPNFANSVQLSSDRCLQLLVTWNVSHDVTDHVTALTVALTDAGREDLLFVLLCEETSYDDLRTSTDA